MEQYIHLVETRLFYEPSVLGISGLGSDITCLKETMLNIHLRLGDKKILYAENVARLCSQP